MQKKDNMTQKKKILLINISIIICFLIILGRLFQVQILEHDKYKSIVKKQTQIREFYKPERGLIYDRNMKLIATNNYIINVSVYPKKINNKDTVASILNATFGNTKDYYLNVLKIDSDNEFLIEPNIKLSDIKKLEDISKIDGIIIKKTPYRYYLNNRLASQVIGFTDENNEGKCGIEYAYNKELSGSYGLLVLQKDGLGNKRPFAGFFQKYPEAGSNIVLTIDLNIQEIVENELKKGLSEFKAQKGKAVVISVKTGEIIAMANYPGFDLNNIKATDTNYMVNGVIADLYEPGSTFKLITAAATLEENLANSNTNINTENGIYKKGTYEFKDEHPAQSMTFRQVIAYSSNIGTIKLAEMLGKERLYYYARDFGIGSLTGIELYGENRGRLKMPYEFQMGTLEYMSIGYQVLVNQLQLSMAYSSIANNGVLLKPQIIKKIFSKDGKTFFECKPIEIRKVISETTAKTLNSFFTGVVEKGTAMVANLGEVKVAGKTGTTQRVIDGKYRDNSHNASFIGYFPADNPVILISIFFDDISGTGNFYGGQVAAPVFKRISERIIEYIGYERIYSSDVFNEGNLYSTSSIQNVKDTVKNNLKIPELKGKDLYNVVKILDERKIKFEVTGKPEINSDKIPPKKYIVIGQHNSTFDDGSLLIKLNVKEIQSSSEKDKIVPDVINMSIRRAITKLFYEGFIAEVEGKGKVVSQIPEAGTVNPKSNKIKLICN
ncbi:MAG: penicillin-binding transpeptidase domain-containing protein [Ignavibacteria bacterium]|nr:penicillin-binding transpeptidase domain-containing protein [Ignavibacteria bacterium]